MSFFITPGPNTQPGTVLAQDYILVESGCRIEAAINPPNHYHTDNIPGKPSTGIENFNHHLHLPHTTEYHDSSLDDYHPYYDKVSDHLRPHLINSLRDRVRVPPTLRSSSSTSSTLSKKIENKKDDVIKGQINEENDEKKKDNVFSDNDRYTLEVDEVGKEWVVSKWREDNNKNPRRNNTKNENLKQKHKLQSILKASHRTRTSRG